MTRGGFPQIGWTDMDDIVVTPGAPRLSDGPPSDYARLLSEMLRIRRFEEEVQKLFSQNLMRGSTHLCQGQEAVTVGVAAVTQSGDTMTCSYRGHGAVLAHGADLDRCFGEMLGRRGGLAQGRGGSMHLSDAERGILGSNAIVGAQIPIAVGAALTFRLRGTGAISVTYFGDGATNIGAFHEAVNMAAIWKLPVLFVLENNHYGEYSPLERTTPISRLAARATSYGIPGVHVDGNDVLQVRHVAGQAAARARAGEGPTLIEADTYRQSGHSRSDPATYRPEGELDRWLRRDPIRLLEDAVRATGESAAAEIESIRQSVEREVVEARDRALRWPSPEAAERFEDVWA